MHPNPVFHDADDQRNLGFARDTGFGILTLNGDDTPLLSHVPFVLNDEGTEAIIHLVRSNPIARVLKAPKTAKIAVSGPDAYVSPDWYGVDDQVPTWNYVAVHLTGRLELLPQDELRSVLDQQSAFFEARLTPKTPWTADKMTPDMLERMMRQIVPCRFSVQAVDGTWKLGQNKTPEVREAAATEIDAVGFGTDPRVLAALMRGCG